MIPTSSAQLHAMEAAESNPPQSQQPASQQPASRQPPPEDWVTTTSHVLEESIARPASDALHSFFYPPVRERDAHSDDDNDDDMERPRRTRRRRRPPSRNATARRQEFDQHFYRQQQEDKKFVERFWTAFDDIVILSLFTQVGIVARLGVATWFTFFEGVFSNDSALFVNLPLNCLSCFLMGMLGSGESLMEIIATRFSPPRSQQALHPRHLQAREPQEESHGLRHDDDDDDEKDDDSSDDGVLRMETDAPWNARPRRLRRRRRPKRARTDRPDRFWWEPPVRLDEELRDVQLLALERRIRQSKCLLLFPLKKEDVDVMEHYFDEGYRKNDEEEEENERPENDDDHDGLAAVQPPKSYHGVDDDMQRVMDARRSLENDLALEESEDQELSNKYMKAKGATTAVSPPLNGESRERQRVPSTDAVDLHSAQTPASGTDLNQMVNDVSANVTENITRLRRANLADGWDVGTTPEAMSDDLVLGLRFGFCGALSSFSSWNSAMINLIRDGHIGDALVGYMLGVQLPIVAYRFGQHVAVFIFIWRCRQENKRDERRGYGIRVAMNENSERDEAAAVEEDHLRESSERETPSIRAVATALFVMALVTQCTSIYFYTDPESQVVALSLLFSPLGVIARWRLARYNVWRPTFPVGTFFCNILACALSGGLGTLLAGNPGERERLVLVSFINGFGGTLSSVAAFIVEILAGIDPVLLRFDGAVYALLSIFWAMVVGFLFTASADWADETG